MLAFEKRPRGARGWLRTRHAYRQRIVDEIQKRAEYPLTDYARVSRIMLAGPTATDVFRRELLRRRSPETEGDEEKMREALRKMITTLAPDGRNESMGRAYDSLAEAIDAVTQAMPPVQKAYRNAAADAFETLLDAYKPGGVFAAPQPDPGEGRDVAFGSMPFRSGGARGKYWLNLTRPGDEARLRLHRESYPANETISIWQDYPRPETRARSHLLDRDGSAPRLNVACAAIDAFDALLEREADTLGRYRWVGDLLSVSHFWCVPARDVLPDLNPAALDTACAELRADPFAQSKATEALFTAAARFADRSFPHRDLTSDQAQRHDHVITVIGDGEAILIADFQPHSRDPERRERATRYALLNLSAPPDKLGRLIMRLHDIESYRIVALRDYQFTFPVSYVIETCNAHIAQAENEAARKLKTRSERRKQMKHLLERIMDLSARITAANHFIESGVVGLADRGVEMQGLIRTRLSDLNERPVLGFQSLTGYVKKVDNAVNSMQRSKARYVRARERIDEIVNLARAEIDQVETETAQFRAWIALFLTIALIGVESVAGYVDRDMAATPGAREMISGILLTAIVVIFFWSANAIHAQLRSLMNELRMRLRRGYRRNKAFLMRLFSRRG